MSKIDTRFEYFFPAKLIVFFTKERLIFKVSESLPALFYLRSLNELKKVESHELTQLETQIKQQNYQFKMAKRAKLREL